MKKNITQLFNKFAGREVPMKEELVTWTGKNLGTVTFTDVSLADENDPTIREMEKLAKKNGVTLRIEWTGKMSLIDHKDDRVNVFIEKAPDGKWRISNRFEIG